MGRFPSRISRNVLITDLLLRHIEASRESVRFVISRHPFVIHAWTIFPEHLHYVIELPPDNVSFCSTL